MKKTRLKLTAIMLTVCMLTAMLPTGAMATTQGSLGNISNDDNASIVTSVTEEKEYTELEAIIVEEDISKRQESEKHFICDDGSFIAVTYSEPIHEKVGKHWVEKEYKVTEKADETISPADETLKLSLAKMTGGTKLAELESGEYKISWTVEASRSLTSQKAAKLTLASGKNATTTGTKAISAENTAKAKSTYSYADVLAKKTNAKTVIDNLGKDNTAAIKNNVTVKEANEAIERYNQEKIQSVSYPQAKVEYKDALGSGMSVRYMLSPGRMHEEIVLDSYNGFESYSMVMDTDGLIPELSGRKKVLLKDTDGKVRVIIASPLMYDDSGAASDEIEIELENEGGKWRITYKPDKEWLTEGSREYPVVIDPQVQTPTANTVTIKDEYVYSGQSEYSDMNEAYLYVGYYGGIEHIAYWGVDALPTLPSNAAITDTFLRMRFADGTTTMQPIGVYSTTGTYTSGYVNWYNKPTALTLLNTRTTVPSDCWFVFKSELMTNVISDRYKDGAPFNVAIKYTPNALQNDYNWICSSDYPVTANRPYLKVSYLVDYATIPTGTYNMMAYETEGYLTLDEAEAPVGSDVGAYDVFGDDVSQRWDIIPAGGNAYYIIPCANTDRMLYCDNNGQVSIQNRSSTPNGKWLFVENEANSGYYTIISYNKPWYALDSWEYNELVDASLYHGGDSQAWSLEDATGYDITLPDGDYFIKNVYSDMYMYSGDIGDPLWVNNLIPTDIYIFNVLKQGSGSYRIKTASKDSYYVGLDNHSTQNGNNFTMQHSYGGVEEFNFIKHSDGTYSIRPTTSESDVMAVSMYDDETIVLQEYDLTDYHKWILIPIETVDGGNLTQIQLKQGESIWYNIIAPVAGIFTFSSSSTGNTFGRLYKDGVQINYDDNSGTGNNFSFIHTLAKGSEYYLEVSNQSSGYLSCSVEIYKYKASINNYFDNGYCVRTNKTHYQASQEIYSITETVAEVFWKRFGMMLTQNIPEYYQTNIDLCKGTVSTTNIDQPCQDVDCQCTNRANVINDFNANKTNGGDVTVTNCLWSFHLLDRNRCISDGSGVFMVDNNTIGNLKNTLFHEMSHQFTNSLDYSIDHYHDPETEDENKKCEHYPICSGCGEENVKRESQCIMVDTVKYSISAFLSSEEAILYCDACYNDVLSCLEDQYK